jgi:hypothetical protein
VYFVWRASYYGYFLPNSFYAKVGGGMSQYEQGVNYLVAGIEQYWLAVFLLVPLASATGRLATGRVAYLSTLVVAWGSYVVYVGGDSLGWFRFGVPALPIAYGLLGSAAGALASQLRAGVERVSAQPLAVAPAAAALVVLGVASLYGSRQDSFIGYQRIYNKDREIQGRWLKEHVPPDYLLAVHGAGILPYYAELPALDLLGINDEHIAHEGAARRTGYVGHEKYDSRYVLARRPDVIQYSINLDPRRFGQADYASPPAWVPAIGDLLAQPEFWELYAHYGVEVEPGRWFNFLVLRSRLSEPPFTEPAAGR